MTWRARFAPIIRRVLDDTDGLPYVERRHRLWEHYPLPFVPGLAASYRHRIWMDEIRRQLGHKKKRKGLQECEGAQRRLL